MISDRSKVRFSTFEADFTSGTLRKHGIKIRLQEQPFQILGMLVERAGEVVTREELQKRLWPDTQVDFERGLNRAVNRLRDALGDNADNPKFIETLPLRGYRFIFPVKSDEDTRPPEPSVSANAAGFPRRRLIGALAAGGFAVTGLIYFTRRSNFTKPIRTLAVLPLVNLSHDPEQEYFSDGLTDELIGELARSTSLQVISWTSSRKYKGSGKSLPEMARELGADAVLEGTVVRSGAKVRISAQLIRAGDDRHLWSAKYEREMSDLLVLQGEVARAVAEEIHAKLTAPDARSGSRPINPDAHEAFLRGTYFLNKGAPGVFKSIQYFREAIRHDPEHAESHASLAEAQVYSGIFGFQPSAKALQEARISALNALLLDKTNASAHNVLGDVKKGYDWNLAEAELEYGRALKSNPSHILTHLWYAECLARMNRFKDALEQSARAISIDPVSALSHNNRAMLFFRARRFDESIRASLEALDLDPSLTIALWWQGVSYCGKRDYPNAIRALKAVVEANPSPMFRGYLGFAYGMAGNREKALGMVHELRELSVQRFVSPINLAIIYAGLKDADQTFDWLEKAYSIRETRIHELPSLYFDAFRHDERYKDLLKRIGLAIWSRPGLRLE